MIGNRLKNTLFFANNKLIGIFAKNPIFLNGTHFGCPMELSALYSSMILVHSLKIIGIKFYKYSANGCFFVILSVL